MVPGSDLHQGGDVAARPDGDGGEREVDPDHVEEPLLDAEPIALAVGSPLDELDDQLDLLPVPHGGHAEEVLDADDAEAPDLHAVLDDRVAGSVDRVLLAAGDLDDVVRHQPVPAGDEVEGDLALADA